MRKESGVPAVGRSRGLPAEAGRAAMTGSSRKAMSPMDEPQQHKHTMSKNLLYLGLDVHAQTVVIAIAEAGGEVRNYGTVSSDLEVLERVMRKIKNAHPGCELRVCYEAGPT